MAPADDATLAELTRPEKRPPELHEPIPPEVLDSECDEEVDFSLDSFVNVLRKLPRGSSSGPGGMTYEHLKLCLEDEETTALMYLATLRMARGQAPRNVNLAVMCSRLTALKKTDGGIRGIATGTS